MEDIFRQLGAGIHFNPKLNAVAQALVLDGQASVNTPTASTSTTRKVKRLDYFNSKKRARDAAPAKANPIKKPRLEKKEKIATPTLEGNIKLAGSDAPKAIKTWADFPLPSYLLRNVVAAGYTKPTPVQAQVLPSIANGREVLVAAPTGSGKTAAYCIPLLVSLKKPRSSNGVRSLIILPTRELATQVEAELRKLSEGKPFRIVSLASSDAANLNADILLTTPMRLQSLVGDQTSALASCEHVILDECDKLLSEEFLQQIDDVFTAITNSNRRVHMFSATMVPFVEELAKSVMRDPLRVLVGAKNAVVKTIEQKLVYCGSEKGKLIALREHIRSGVKVPALIFVQSRERAEELFREMMFDNLRVDLLTGARTAAQRAKATEDFRAGKVHFLIATDLLSRGLDFKGVNLVVNYDLPLSPVDYIHRVGRTGRMGRQGAAHTYYSDDDLPRLRQIVNVIKQSGQEVPAHLKEIKMLKTQEKSKKPVERSSVGTDSLEQQKEMALLKEQWAKRTGKKFKGKKQQRPLNKGAKPIGTQRAKISKSRGTAKR